jgi:hypothetical protein
MVRVDLRRATLYPWFEYVRSASDHYSAIDFGPINRISVGVAESRVRFGIRVRTSLPHSLRLEARLLYEHVESLGFSPGASRDNGGVEAMLVWTPTSQLQ